MIFNIQRFSIHDGQGIRTMIFFKGCPLRCSWCCNPESQSFGHDLMYDNRLCKNFKDCLATDSKFISDAEKGININWSEVRNPVKFKNVCASGALKVSGDEMSVDMILSEIEKDRLFYQGSSGGVTFSGGEPLAQGNELDMLLLDLKKRGIDVSIESSLHVPWNMIERCIDLTGTFLADLKHTGTEKFRKFTGGNAGLVFENITKLSKLHKNVIIRVPVIPGFNHSENEMKEIIDYTVSLKTVREIHFLPFHSLGAEKYRMMGMEYSFKGKKQVEQNELKGYINYATSMGLAAKAGG